MRVIPSFLTRQLFILVVIALLPVSGHARWLQDTRVLMGTEVTVEFMEPGAGEGDALLEAVFTEFHRPDQMMNPWNEDSVLARVNRDAFARPVTVPAEMVTVLERALHYSRLSGGAFDVSFAAAAQYYDFRRGRAPSQAERKQGVRAIDYRSVELDTQAATVRFLRPGMALDFGGIAKGFAVDRGIAVLRAAGVEAAVVSAGGDSRMLGDLGDRPRMVGIRHPRQQGEYVAIIPLSHTAISTSGDYERFFERDGVRYHHILDPATGDSARAVLSASVIAAQAMDSDALSTTVFVLGVERGLALVNRLPGVDAIIIDGQGRLHYSAELLLSTKE